MANMVERYAAARRIFEDSAADPGWIAGALGISPASLETVARRENWRRREGMGDTLDRLLAQLSAQLRLFEDQAEAAEGLSKAQLDALLAITRTFDRLGEMKRAEEARRAEGPDDAMIETARAAVERRVGELSEQRAATMVDLMAGEGPAPDGDGTDDEANAGERA